MKLNTFEFLAMNNPFRAFSQEVLEIRRLRKLSSLSTDKTVLEIGCGNGTGAKLIQKYFSPKEIFAIDLDEKMIEIAEKRNGNKNIKFEVASATKLPYENNTFDAIFDFGVIHHIPNWKDCLKELKRVLKPNGELILEDLSIETFETFFGKFMKATLEHPYKEMYKQKEFTGELKNLKFKIKKEKKFYPFKLIKYFTVIAGK